MSLPPALKNEVLALMDDLPPEAVGEVGDFIAFLKVKHQKQPQPPVAIRGWLVGYRFTSDEIAEARAEMWARFTDDTA